MASARPGAGAQLHGEARSRLHPRRRRPGEVRADPRLGVAAPRRRRGRRRARRRGHRVTALVVRACGPMTSIQDAGRFGWQRYGVSSSGAMDRFALALANALVGNAPGAGALEFMLMGGAFEVEAGSARLAIAGAPCA